MILRATDTAGAPVVVVVSETLARRFWPRQPAIGKPLRLEVFNARARPCQNRTSATVIGVAGDIRSSSLIDGLAEPYVYLPLAQSDAVGSEMTAQMSIVARRRGGDQPGCRRWRLSFRISTGVSSLPARNHSPIRSRWA